MAKSSSIDNYYKKTGFERHKGFFSVLFTLLLLIGVLVSYTAVQQQRVYKSKALESPLIPPTVSSASCDGEFVTLNVNWNNPRDLIGNIGLSFGANETQLKFVCDQHKSGGVYLAGTVHCQAPRITSTRATYKWRVSGITKEAGDTRLLAVLRGTNLESTKLTPWTAVTVSCEKPLPAACPYSANQNCSVAPTKIFCDACSQKFGGCEWKNNKCVEKGSGGTGGVTSVCATTYKGTCQKDNLPCDGGYVSGLCPGGANIRCCTISCVTDSKDAKCPSPLVCDTTKITSSTDKVGRCVPESEVGTGGSGGGGIGSGGGGGGTGSTGGQTTEKKCGELEIAACKSRDDCTWSFSQKKCLVDPVSEKCFKQPTKSSCEEVKDCEWKKVGEETKCRKIQEAEPEPVPTDKPGCVSEEGGLCGDSNIVDGKKKFCCTSSGLQCKLADGGQKKCLTPEAPGVDTALSLKLKFQGIPPQTQQVSNTMTVKVTLDSPTLEERKETTAEFTSDESGLWSGAVNFENIHESDDFTLFIKGPKHVQKKICDPQPSGGEFYRCSEGAITLETGENTLDLTGATLLVGDLPDQDGVVDSFDISLIRNLIDQSEEVRRSAQALVLADLNLDGVIDSQDHSLLISSLEVKYDEE